MKNKSVNILVTSKMNPAYIKQIQSVSPMLKVADISDLFYRDPSIANPDFQFGIIKSGNGDKEKLMDGYLQNAEILYGNRLPNNLTTRGPNVKWVQVTMTGVNQFLSEEIKASNIILTNGRGIAAVPISEFIIGLMLQFAKNTAFFSETKRNKQWIQQTHMEILRSKTVGILGLGKIGQEIARLAHAFHMRVIGLDNKPLKRFRNVDVLVRQSGLKQLLAESDYVVLTLPLYSETMKIIGEKELRIMKPTSYLINTSRGELIDEQALIQTLAEKRIAGAGLDVYCVEPLPPDNKLWELPNVIMSPHMSGQGVDVNAEATKIFCKNLERYLNNKRLYNIVDKNLGYVVR